jgi:hypothetical protein
MCATTWIIDPAHTDDLDLQAIRAATQHAV